MDDIYNVIEKFSKGKLYFSNTMINRIVLFKSLMVGASHQCQRCITLDYSLKYSREYNITKLLRDRMYKAFNITPTFNFPLLGVIVHNKRFSVYEIELLKNLTNYYNNNKIIQLQYIDYANISGFYNQLKLLSKVHLYISGPGTGLLNFPFISDPGIVIHLGHVHFGCPQYLEQYILEGSPHIKTIYYSSKMRMKKMNFTYLVNLINKSLKYIEKNSSFYIPKTDNLNYEGKLFVRICNDYKNICENLIRKYNWAKGCRGIWAENVIYFPSLYKHIPQLKDIVLSYNDSYNINLGCKIGINYSKQNQWC